MTYQDSTTNLEVKQILGLLAKYYLKHYRYLLKTNKSISLFVQRRSRKDIKNLAKDQEAKALALEYLQSFQLIQDALKANINPECLTCVKQLFIDFVVEI